MKETWLEKFIELNSDFGLELDQLSRINREKFVRNFRKQKTEENFLSTLSEFRFAQFLERELFVYEYEPTIDGKKPDFKFELSDNELVYFDVKRFNISDFDKDNERVIFELAELLTTIKKPFYILLDQLKKDLDFDINTAFREIEKWILQGAIKEGDIYVYNNLLHVEIIKTNGICDHVLYLYTGEDPKVHPSKLKSDILSKIKAYKEVIIDNGFPFFVAIDLTSGILRNPSVYWDQFLGRSCLNINTGIEYFQLGEFYADSDLNGLTGILIRYNSQFYWLNNPKNNVRIKFRSAELKYE